MEQTDIHSSKRYDVVAPRWGDKMRTLGYYDAYLGFLAEQRRTFGNDVSLIDVGAGTGAFAEAWVAMNGAPRELTLLEPSGAMLERGHAALSKRGVEPRLVQSLLGATELAAAEVVLAAHVIEHCPDPLIALQQMHDLLHSGGRLHLVVSKPHWCNAIIWLQWRHRTFHESEIASLIREAGFEIEMVYTFPSGPPSRTSRGIVAVRAD